MKKNHSSAKKSSETPKIFRYTPAIQEGWADRFALQMLSAVTKDLEVLSTAGNTVSPQEEEASHPQMTYNHAQSQIDKLLKKYVPSTVDEEKLKDECYNDFIENNTRLKNFSFHLPGPLGRAALNAKCAPRDRVLERARLLIASLLGSAPDIEKWYEKCRHSSGVSSGLKFVDTSLEAKTTWPMTYCGERMEKHIYAYLHWDKEYSNAILENFSSRLIRPEAEKVNFIGPHPKHRKKARIVNHQIRMFKRVSGTKLSAVKKSVTEMRGIAPEATWNMFHQAGLMEYMYELLLDHGIDLSIAQTVHGELAKEASLNPAKWATIDFKRASDCVALVGVEFLFPPGWYDRICDVRSDFTFVKGEAVELAMVGTMGNATTFPIETIVFWALGCSILQEVTRKYTLMVDYELQKQVRVFGDDVILPTFVAVPFMELCVSMGFLVNAEKSHYREDDYFRESCGTDCFRGLDVGIFKLQNPNLAPSFKSRSDKQECLKQVVAAKEAWLYIIMNRIYPVYVRLGFTEDKILHSYVFSLCFRQFEAMKSLLYIVPDYYPEDSGFAKLSDPLNSFHKLPSSVTLAPIVQDEHRTLFFSYLAFKLEDQKRAIGNIRLWDALKKAPVNFYTYVCPFPGHLENAEYVSTSIRVGATQPINRKHIVKVVRYGIFPLSLRDIPSQGKIAASPFWFSTKKKAGNYQRVEGVSPYFVTEGSTS